MERNIVLVLVLDILLANGQQMTVQQQLKIHIESPWCRSVAAPKGLDFKLVQAYREVLSLM